MTKEQYINIKNYLYLLWEKEGKTEDECVKLGVKKFNVCSEVLYLIIRMFKKS